MAINVWQNNDFEEGWYHKDKKPEYQIPVEHEFEDLGTGTPNPIDPSVWAEFVPPEIRVLPKDQLPSHEQDVFVLSRWHCLKMFKGNGAWWGVIWQSFEALEPGMYLIVLQMFADLVKDYKDGQKVWADDPQGRDGQIRYAWRAKGGIVKRGEWISLVPGKWNRPECELEVLIEADFRIGIEIRCPFPLKNSGIFADLWTMEKIEEVPDPDPEIPPGSDAREPYHKSAVLVNPDQSPGDIAQRAKTLLDLHRWSVDSSADDPAVGRNLLSKTIYALNPDEWPGSLEDYYRTYYPDVGHYYPIFHYNDTQLNGRLLAASLHREGFVFKAPTTYDGGLVVTEGGEFGNQRVGYIHKGLDLKSSYASWGDLALAPIAGRVIRAGYYDDEPWYGIQIRIETILDGQRKLLTRLAHLAEGSLFVSQGDMVKAGQIVAHPDNSGNSTGDHLHVDVRYMHLNISDKMFADPAILLGMHVLPVPDPDPDPDPDPPPGNVPPIYPPNAVGTFGLQRIGGFDGMEYFLAGKPPLHKVVDDFGNLAWVKRHFGDVTECMARKHIGHQDPHLSHPEQAKDLLTPIVSDVITDMRGQGVTSGRIWIEFLNETYSHDPAVYTRGIAHDIACVRALAEINQESYPEYDLRPAPFSAGVGNIQMPLEGGGHEAWMAMLPLCQLVAQYGGALTYHAYHAGNAGDPAMFHRLAPWLQNRWMAFDAWLVKRGVYLYWMLGEVGSCSAWTTIDEQGNETIHWDAGSGWQRLYNKERYADELVVVDSVWRRWNAQNGGRLLGGSIFQSGSLDKEAWGSFALEGADLRYVSDRIRNA